MSVRKIKQKIDKLDDELYMLHFVEKRPKEFTERKYQLELEIAQLEDQLSFEKIMAKFRNTLIIFACFAFAAALYAILR